MKNNIEKTKLEILEDKLISLRKEEKEILIEIKKLEMEDIEQEVINSEKGEEVKRR